MAFRLENGITIGVCEVGEGVMVVVIGYNKQYLKNLHGYREEGGGLKKG